jgi:hypothetical protein
MPSHTRYAAPARRMAVYTSAEALRIAAIPSTDAVAQINSPVSIPSAVSRAARRPPRSALRVTTAMSGRGVMMIRPATIRNGTSDGTEDQGRR